MECGLQIPAGCSVECGWEIGHSGTLTGGARYRALLGWGLLLSCCVSAFRGASWASAGRASWPAVFARLLFNSHEYHVHSVETNTIFLTRLQNLESLKLITFLLYIIVLCKGHMADHVELEKKLLIFISQVCEACLYRLGDPKKVLPFDQA